LIDLGCDVLANDEDGDNALHLCIIKKANFVQEVSQAEAPKIYEIYENLSFLTRHRLMYTLLCFLAQSGCKMTANYKGAQVFDWIPEKEIRDLILSYEAKAAQNKPNDRNVASTSNEATSANSEIGELYNNIESLNLTVNDTTNSSVSNVVEVEVSSNNKNSGSSVNSNPPTPARRNRIHSNVNNNNNNNRDTTPSPSLNYLISGGSGSSSVPTEDEMKKLNVDQSRNEALINRSLAISPPPVPVTQQQSSTIVTAESHPTTSSANDAPARVQNVETNPSQSPPLPMPPVPRHSRKPNKSQLASNPTSEQLECIVCNEVANLISFEPCLCKIACEDCCIRMKKCLACGVFIEKRITPHGKILHSKESNRQPSADRLRYLESKILEIEEHHCCSICMERRRNVAFLCGHSACSKCADTLKTCHMCRKNITKKINLY
jgi:E3 ubiquitin-protein ligase mind-bomb